MEGRPISAVAARAGGGTARELDIADEFLSGAVLAALQADAAAAHSIGTREHVGPACVAARMCTRRGGVTRAHAIPCGHCRSRAWYAPSGGGGGGDEYNVTRIAGVDDLSSGGPMTMTVSGARPRSLVPGRSITQPLPAGARVVGGALVAREMGTMSLSSWEAGAAPAWVGLDPRPVVRRADDVAAAAPAVRASAASGAGARVQAARVYASVQEWYDDVAFS